jgi:hypothetical protein
VNVSWEQALPWRMRRHYLLERAAPRHLAAVFNRLCGLHAQLMSSVDLALWARIDGLERDAVAHALWRQRTLVKMWAMRSTLQCCRQPISAPESAAYGSGNQESGR